jgi:hypothetical protein
LIDTGLDAVEEVKEKFTKEKFDKSNIVYTVKKEK